MSYKRLGDFIQLVDERNKDLKITNLVGLTINKKFIPSVANIIGTDMSNYKIIQKNQFACSTMQVRRDKKMPIALLKEFDEAIISQAYPIFEVIDTQILLPEYLMMWFSRVEFDREACFHAVGGVRGSLEWEDFCNFKIPIPSIEKQREIVAQYQSIAAKIKTNEALCQKLEATAQTLYKHWFVDFEFPNENGKPYFSSGGEMVYHEELQKEIPKGWEVKSLGEIAEVKAGGDKPKIFSEEKTEKCSIPIFANGIENNGLFGFTNEAKYPEKSITISARGTIGYCVLREEAFVGIVRLIIIIPKDKYISTYLIQYFSDIEFSETGSVQNQLTIPQVSIVSIIVPTDDVLKKYDEISNKINSKIRLLNEQTQVLKKLQSLLLGQMGKYKK